MIACGNYSDSCPKARDGRGGYVRTNNPKTSEPPPPLHFGPTRVVNKPLDTLRNELMHSVSTLNIFQIFGYVRLGYAGTQRRTGQAAEFGHFRKNLYFAKFRC